jgi:hypothetical protein
VHLIVGSARPQRRPHDAMGLFGGKDPRGYFISGKAEPRPRSSRSGCTREFQTTDGGAGNFWGREPISIILGA